MRSQISPANLLVIILSDLCRLSTLSYDNNMRPDNQLPSTLRNAIQYGPWGRTQQQWAKHFYRKGNTTKALRMNALLTPSTVNSQNKKRFLRCLKTLLEINPITTLDLSNNDLSTSINDISALLADRPSLLVLNVSNCQLTTLNFSIARMRRAIPELRCLHLEGNKLDVCLQRDDNDEMTDTEEMFGAQKKHHTRVMRNLLHLGGFQHLDILNLSNTGLQFLGKRLVILSWVLARYTRLSRFYVCRNGLSPVKCASVIAGFDELRSSDKRHVLRISVGLDNQKTKSLEQRLDIWNQKRTAENQDQAVVCLGMFSKHERDIGVANLDAGENYFTNHYRGPNVEEILKENQVDDVLCAIGKAASLLVDKKDETDQVGHIKSYDSGKENAPHLSNKTNLCSMFPIEVAHHVSQYMGSNKCPIKLVKTPLGSL